MKRSLTASVLLALISSLISSPAAAAGAPELVAAYVSPTDWENINKTVFGTGFWNAFGLRSRPASTPVSGMFVFDRTVPTTALAKFEIWESTIDGQQKKILGPSKVTSTRLQKSDRTAIKFTTPNITVHGDKNYIAILKLTDSNSQSLGTFQTSFSLEYSMSVGCAIPSMLSMTVRDTSKGFLSLVSLASTTLEATVAKVIPKRLSAAKRAKILAFIKKANAAGLAADEGLKLIDITQVYAEGGDVTVELVLQATKDVASKRFKTVETTLTLDDTIELAKLLSLQGGVNADAVSKACNVGTLAASAKPNDTPLKKETTAPKADMGTATIERWFGKGWIGKAATCAQILSIVKALPENSDVAFDQPRVVAINPSARAMWVYSVSLGSGDPLFSYYGPRSAQGGLWGVGSQQDSDIFKLLDGSGDFWTEHALVPSGKNVTCTDLNR